MTATAYEATTAPEAPAPSRRELVDLDALASETDVIICDVKIGGRIIPVPNMGLKPMRDINEFGAYGARNDIAGALGVVFGEADAAFIMEHANVAQVSALMGRIGAAIEAVAGSAGEDNGSRGR
ncbi:hypothetical protein H8R18_01315 [Nanchangia anserum]|uniref:Uncharacterized protein n=1 Tax=Nanchangia anserum TaxID=2692125 RepID=A0A8I0GD98_9ACTO|nr:hypothetical protein [Nanchangia anserum]MBD3689876.1 hypothetical protein [Nanchangia anserum]QOX82044.1 hypothetical protein H8R18_01315 [Nanchangia anserum]